MDTRAEYIELKGSRKEQAAHNDGKQAEADLVVRDWSDQEEKIIRRRVDWRMYPML